jgi:hypothetical protein
MTSHLSPVQPSLPSSISPSIRAFFCSNRQRDEMGEGSVRAHLEQKHLYSVGGFCITSCPWESAGVSSYEHLCSGVLVILHVVYMCL